MNDNCNNSASTNMIDNNNNANTNVNAKTNNNHANDKLILTMITEPRGHRTHEEGHDREGGRLDEDDLLGLHYYDSHNC